MKGPNRRRSRQRHIVGLGLVCAGLVGALPARAQLAGLVSGPDRPISKSSPVTFLADQVSYDRQTGIVTATGNVEAWQNGHILYADKVVIDRNHNTATAIGHVVMMEPSGEIAFAKRADLSQGMKNAVMRDVASILAENGRIIANGARRYGGVINELSKPVYSTCDLCKHDPTAAPLWQIKARSAIEDLRHKVIEYHDAELQIYGFPVFWLPYMSQPDPSVKRQSGVLIPSFGSSTHIGEFLAIPYFWDISKSQDATIVPIIATKAGPVLDVKYRQALNNGKLTVNISAGHDRYANNSGLSDAIFSTGTFDLNNTWRAGFSYNHTSSTQYLNDFRYLPNASFLASNAYIEGFGEGSYAKIDAQTYQGLVATITQSEVPIVAPYARYDYFGSPDAWGGRFSMAASAYNVLREVGTESRRVAVVSNYDLPFDGPDGILFDSRVRLIAAGYSASKLNEQPNFSDVGSAQTARAIPIGAVSMRWPLERNAGTWGEQIIEPRVQLEVAPSYGLSQTQIIPNEDSLDFQFTDANLFSLQRFGGIDRFAGGSRVDYALQGSWYLPGGAYATGLIGQSYSFHKSLLYPPGSGLNDNVSDIVGRATVAPLSWLSFTYRTRLSHQDLGARMIDAYASVGNNALRVNGGYFYSTTNPYYLFTQAGPPPAAYYIPRREFTLGASTSLIPHWTFAGSTQRNIETGQFDNAAMSATWQNECTAVNISFYRSFTSFNYDHGTTTLLINITLKTLGNFGFSAL
ncbi:MAG: LPS assembly protein LptD [Acidiphilium sp.]|nr:LPS assembly protein LptD [Acidiphilium sp.]MDD4935224.1 LPS assembly protein LptD [Acidiphilium sp.]